MANRRMINKDDCENPKFQTLTDRQWRIWHGVNLYGDSEGRMYTQMVAAKVYPFGCDFDMLQELKEIVEKTGSIILYGDSLEYLQVDKWRATSEEWGRQQIKNEPASQIPSLQSYRAKKAYEQKEEEARTSNEREATPSRVECSEVEKSKEEVSRDIPVPRNDEDIPKEPEKPQDDEVKPPKEKKPKWTFKYFKDHKEEALNRAKELYPHKDCDKAMQVFIEDNTIKKYHYDDYRLAFFKWVREDPYNKFSKRTGINTVDSKGKVMAKAGKYSQLEE